MHDIHAFRTIEIRAQDKKGDTIELALSSEAPVERWFGIEILSHDREAVDLSRLAAGRHPLLLNHDTTKQIGVIERAWLDEDRKVRAEARFGRSALAQEIAQDVADEIRTLVSVGYMIHEVTEETVGEDGEHKLRTLTGDEFRREMREKFGEHFYREGPCAMRAKEPQKAPPVYRVTRWTPFEGSVVPIPADVDVGVGRSAGAEGNPEQASQPPRPAEQVTQPTQPIERIITMEPNKPLEGQELERARTAAILALAEHYARFLGPNDAADYIRNGRTAEQFREHIMARMEAGFSDVSQRLVGMSPKEVQRYSLARAVLAMATGDWSQAGLEREASNATAKLFGRTPEGIFVPFDYWQARDFNIGTATEAGNLRPTDLRTDLFADALRNAIVLGRLGMRVLPGLSGNVDIPRKSVAGTLGMLAEIGSASETQPAIQKHTLTPKRIGAYTEVSKQALIQSAMALEPLIRDDLLQGAAVLIESQVINGVGSNNEMTGLRNTSGIGTVTAGANGAALAWDHLVDLESACANSNAEPGELAGYLINTKTRGKAKKVTKSTYMPFLWNEGATPLNGYRAGVTNNVPSNLTKGTSTTVCSAALFSSNWADTILGLFGAPDITVDPYTKADTGQLKITLNQFADMVNRQPATVSKIEDLLTT